MTAQTIAPAWPEPYRQPNIKQDCTYYAAAYIARCLGRPETTAQDVMAWREETGFHEDTYVERALGAETRKWWEDKDDDERRRRWWLGPNGREWVQSWIDDGWIGYAYVHRISDMAHAVVLLDASDEGVLLMDPVYGHVIEPWDWFLGIGAGTYGCHRVTPWHRKAIP